jgi:hypothetical protein
VPKFSGIFEKPLFRAGIGFPALTQSLFSQHRWSIERKSLKNNENQAQKISAIPLVGTLLAVKNTATNLDLLQAKLKLCTPLSFAH